MILNTQENESHGVLKMLFSKMGWAYREQPIIDAGIDAHVEIADRSGVSFGRLFAVQVKCGKSYFRESSTDGRHWLHRIDASHAKYWSSHTLPVVIILVDLDSNKAYYERFEAHNLISTGKAFKMRISKSNLVGPSAEEDLRKFADGPENIQRYRTLTLAKGLMQAIVAGDSVSLEAEEWVNKSSGKGSISLIVEDDQRIRVEKHWTFLAPGWKYPQLFQEILPWATLTMPGRIYNKTEWEEFIERWSFTDPETGERDYHPELFEDYKYKHPRIEPYDIEYDEVARYKLEVTLNEVGRSFLIMEDFLHSGGDWELRNRVWS